MVSRVLSFGGVLPTRRTTLRIFVRGSGLCVTTTAACTVPMRLDVGGLVVTLVFGERLFFKLEQETAHLFVSLCLEAAGTLTV